MVYRLQRIHLDFGTNYPLLADEMTNYLFTSAKSLGGAISEFMLGKSRW